MTEIIEEKRKSDKAIYWVSGIVVFIVLLAISAVNSNVIQGLDNNNASSNADLNANVSTNINGINVVNRESSDWTGCEVGVNGGCGWNFQDPPYRTHENMTIVAGQSISVSYGSMTTSDGTRFDIATHGVNSVVVMCSMGTNDPIQRSFCGAH